jgi:hypothetical protein
MVDRRHNTIREGVLAGILSATAIAVWLAVVDIIAAHPFFTPEVMGRGLLGIFGHRTGDSPMLYVAVYTVFHYAVFAILGIIVATLVHAARRTPGVLAGFLISFVIFEMGFYGLASLLSVNSDLQGLAWYQIGAANLLAAFVMLYFMWIRHPELKHQFTEALDGTDA